VEHVVLEKCTKRAQPRRKPGRKIDKCKPCREPYPRQHEGAEEGGRHAETRREREGKHEAFFKTYRGGAGHRKLPVLTRMRRVRRIRSRSFIPSNVGYDPDQLQ